MAWIKVGLAALLLAGVAWGVDPPRAWALARTLSPQCLALVLLLAGLGLGVQWYKWQALARWYRPQLSAGELWNSLVGGMVLGVVSPGRLGELGRGLFLPGEQRVYLRLAVVDRLGSFGTTALLGVWGAWSLGLAEWIWGGVFLGACGLGLWAAARRAGFLKGWFQAIGAIPLPIWGRNLAGALLFNLVFFGQFYLLAADWMPFSIKEAGAIPLIYALKGLAPLSFMDLGVREGVAAFVFERLKLDPAVGFNAALGTFLANVLVPVCLGVRPALKLTRASLSRDPAKG